MPTGNEADTAELLARVEAGENDARQELLDRHRRRLLRMVAVRLDRRVAQRIDPSDVVQDALMIAHRRLDEYIEHQRLPFYAWVRQITWETLLRKHQEHRAGRRAVTREVQLGFSDESIQSLAEQLAGRSSAPSGRLLRAEMRQRVRSALSELTETDREVLVLRYLEQLSTAETADVLECTTSAVKVRLLRALQRLRKRLHGL